MRVEFPAQFSVSISINTKCFNQSRRFTTSLLKLRLISLLEELVNRFLNSRIYSQLLLFLLAVFVAIVEQIRG